MENGLTRKISEEIKKSGFPLELRIANELIKRDYHVAHSLFFVDEDENKSREVDIRALKNYVFSEGIGLGKFIRNCLLIECKKCTKYPWVFLTSPGNAYDQDLFFLPQIPNHTFLDYKNDVPEFEKVHPFGKFKRYGRTIDERI